MANCSLCGKEDLMFTCPYCRGVYCANHRLPEGHGCTGMQQAKDEARRSIADSFTGQYDEEEYDEDIFGERQRKELRKPKERRFTKSEMRDLGIATILTILVSIAILGNVTRISPIGVVNGFFMLYVYILSNLWWFPLSMIFVFWVSFMIHEFAHKFTAQKYGMYAHFRMVTQGYYLSAIAILFAIPIFGTGVMQVGGARNMDEYAKSTVAGPLSNFIVAGSFFIAAELSVIITGSLAFPVDFLIFYGIILNSFLGLFNMIPIPGFDGSTVLRWNKPLWAILTVSLLSTLLIGYFVIPIL
ncbi:MAG: AN1-type zinc finger domain-containing protein [Candidatus Thorarchaeota archaeon]